MKYQSEIIKEIIDTRGHEKSSLHYESECIETWIEENKGAYPKLCDYQAEWLNYINENPIGEFPYLTLVNVTNATVDNVVPLGYKSAILKGSTKYHDIDTEDILDTFDETKKLELVSVKMPVLTTTGKNTIYQVKYETLAEDIQPDSLSNVGYGILDNNDSWTLSFPSSQWIRAYGYDSNGNYTENFAQFTPQQNKKFAIKPSNNLTKIIKFRFWTDEEPQLEKGTQATPYEPFKSNILTVNEEVELRGIGDVQDTLNCLTGEIVESIGEVVLNGSESWKTGLWKNQVDSIGFEVKIKNDVNPSVLVKAISDKILYNSSNNFQKDGEYFDMVGAGNGETWIRLRILRSKLSTEDAVGFKNWLSQNNVKILYELSDKPIKTVDLTITNQDGETLNKLKPIEGTMHLSTSGENISPLFSCEIPVEAITQNLASFIEEE